MAGVIATIPKFQFSSSTGVPLALGTLTVYLAGTTTPTDTWSNSALSSANTNPVQLDSSGSCTLWLDGSKSYKFLLKNAAGTTQWTEDNITGSGGVSSANITYLPAGTGAVATTVQAKLRESVSVLDFYANGVSGVPVDPTGVVDSTLGIQAALNTGRDVIGVGEFKTTAPLSMSATQGQKFVISGSIKPAFRGDVIRIIAFAQNVDVPINGVNQPGTGTAGAAFVIGYGGSNAQQASVAGSRVINFVGNAAQWEQGSMVNFTDFHAQSITGDGILCTSNYDDNNHGFFANTHMISCSGAGYNIKSDAVFGSNLNSRHHVFSNAKAFSCGKNFFIGTIGNIGSVFSELGTAADEFGTNSRGNDIGVLETSAAYSAWVDNGSGNILSGYSNYDQWEYKNFIANMVDINARLEGRRQLSQSGARAFLDEITATVGEVTVTRSKGTASKRTDVFGDRIQFPGSTPLVVNDTQIGSQVVACGTIAAGGTVYFALTGISSAGAGNSLILSISGMTAYDRIGISGYIHSGGDAYAYIINNGAAPVAVGDVTVRWILMKHFA